MAPAIGRFLANIRNSPIGGTSPGIMREQRAGLVGVRRFQQGYSQHRRSRC
jgi:hypothetical protein